MVPDSAFNIEAVVKPMKIPRWIIPFLLFANVATAQQLSQLPKATTPLSGGELLYIVQGGASKQTTASAVSGAGSSASMRQYSRHPLEKPSSLSDMVSGSSAPSAPYTESDATAQRRSSLSCCLTFATGLDACIRQVTGLRDVVQRKVVVKTIQAEAGGRLEIRILQRFPLVGVDDSGLNNPSDSKLEFSFLVRILPLLIRTNSSGEHLSFKPN